jgi:hypothetical protein
MTIFLSQQQDNVYIYIYIYISASYDQFIIQRQLLILNKWQGHCAKLSIIRVHEYLKVYSHIMLSQC